MNLNHPSASIFSSLCFALQSSTKSFRTAAISRWMLQRGRGQGEQDQSDARQHKRIRAAVRRRLDEERHVLQVAHSQSRAALISQLRELPPKDRLELMAWDDVHSLAFYPASFAKVDRQAFDQLDAGSRRRLSDKLAARRTGA